MKRGAIRNLLVAFALGAVTLLCVACADFSRKTWFFYSPPARVDALFWDLILAIEPPTVENLTPDDWMADSYIPRIDLEAIAGMETMYGDMPEYWQMRYFVACNEQNRERREIGWLDPMPPEITREMNRSLEKAVEVAPDDPLSMWLLATKYTYGDDILPEEKALPYLRECARLAPNQAFYHGELAQCLMGLGEYEEAMEYFRKSNAAPLNCHVSYFPLGYVRTLAPDTIDEHEELIPSFGAYLMSPASFDFPHYIFIKDIFKVAVVAFNLNGDLDNLNVMHNYAYRFGVREQGDAVDVLVGNVLIGILRDGVTEMGVFDDDPAASRGIARLNELKDDIEGVIKDRPPSPWEEYFTFKGNRVILKQQGSEWVESYLREEVEWAITPREFLDEARGLLRQIAKFDYTNPAALAR
jgi:tetratricopeptide (TPR) repeat protein